MRSMLIIAGALMFLGSPGAPAAQGAAEIAHERTQAIYNYRKVDERVVTAGQPTEAQLRSVAADGFKTVINLAPLDPRRSLPDEAGLARSLDMAYHHIPVAWERPTDADFAAFERAMQSAGSHKTLVHCAANFRATAFYSLYAMQHLGWSQAQAEEFRASIWSGHDAPAWDAFIARTQARIAAKTAPAGTQ